jgi:hypothetical protein
MAGLVPAIFVFDLKDAVRGQSPRTADQHRSYLGSDPTPGGEEIFVGHGQAFG